MRVGPQRGLSYVEGDLAEYQIGGSASCMCDEDDDNNDDDNNEFSCTGVYLNLFIQL